MKITAVETVRCETFPNLIWVLVDTDQGIAGLGETYFGVAAVETHIHEWAAAKLIGRDPLAIEAAQAALTFYLGFAGTGAEMRAASAIDIALWDLWGKASGQPVHQLLGGAVRDAVPVYNTCAGPRYVRQTTGVSPSNFGLPGDAAKVEYDDLDGFLHRADEVAHSLLEMGIASMKIWPFDFAAEANRGLAISGAELARGLEPFEKVRAALGERMALKAEMHGLWHLPAALRIAEALAPLDIDWIEDPVRLDHLGTLEEFRAAAAMPVAAGETLGGIGQFRDLIEREAVDVPIIDIGWGGGLTVARKVAALADAWRRPVAAHDCSGPVALAACVHFALHCPNVAEQEIARGFYYGWYDEMVTQRPPLADGLIAAPPGPGLGLALRPDFLARPDVRRRRTEAD